MTEIKATFTNVWNRLAVAFTRRVVEGIFLRRAAERFYLVFGGHLFFQTLNAACRFDLFSLLSKEPGLTRQQIADRLGIDQQPARIMLLGLVSCGLLRKTRERYYNTRLSKELLTRESPTNVLPYVDLQHHVMYRGMPHFYEALKAYSNVALKEFSGDEPTLYQRLTHEPQVEKVFHDAMSVLSKQTNSVLARFLDLSHVKRLIDVGGGDATTLITLAKRFPQLHGSVYDLPSVCEIARDRIQQAGLADRLSAIDGDAFHGEYPSDADAFLFAHFCTIWSADKNRQLLKKAYDALPPGGTVIVFNMMQADDETGPLSAAVGSPYFLTIATGEGMLYTWREYEQWMADAGFSSVRRVILPRDHGAIIGTK